MEIICIEAVSHVGAYHNVHYVNIIAHYKCPLCGDIVTPKHWKTCLNETYCVRHRGYLTATHGCTRHPLYKVWKGMRRRCLCSRDKRYKDYGGRGIEICQEWINDAGQFVKWAILNGWVSGLEIDRRDNNGNYEPLNCRFVTTTIQNQNKRTNRFNASEVSSIRKMILNGSTVAYLANIYSCSKSAIRSIKTNRTWKGIQ